MYVMFSNRSNKANSIIFKSGLELKLGNTNILTTGLPLEGLKTNFVFLLSLAMSKSKPNQYFYKNQIIILKKSILIVF